MSARGSELQGLDFQVLLKPVRAEFAAVPRLAEAAERRGHVPCPAVHLDLPGSQPPGNGHRIGRRIHHVEPESLADEVQAPPM